VRYHCRLAGGKGGVPGGSAQHSCRSHGMATRRSGLRHLDLAARPCPNLLDRLAGPRVQGLHRLEEVQNVLRAQSSPQSQELMVGVRKRSPAADGDETGIAIFGKDQGVEVPWRGVVGQVGMLDDVSGRNQSASTARRDRMGAPALGVLALWPAGVDWAVATS